MAVKVYDLRQLGELNKVQLVREIQLHGAFVHRNIVELYAAFQVGGWGGGWGGVKGVEGVGES
jgi:hypothetical protein